MTSPFDDPEQPVEPDGTSIRRRRRGRSWSRRELVAAIERYSIAASGRPDTITRNLLQHIEEANEAVPYRVVVLIAGGLNCDPVDLLAEA